MFSVRIITVDHYMSVPIPELDVSYSDFRGSVIKEVPIVRIFGTSENGEKTCVHVHGVFPYICVPYDGSENSSKLSYQLATSLDKAINISLGYSGANTQHVFKVVLVSGIPFYGFHRQKHQFLKIYFYKPSIIKQAVSLLQNGAVLNRVFQPYEAHIPFILQFFIDFNLHGMSYIQFQEVKFRKTDFPDCLSRISEQQFISDTVAPAMSVSQLEVDALAPHILNRTSNPGDGRIANPGLAAIWEDERQRRSATSGTPVKTPPLHSQRPSLNPIPSDIFFRTRLTEALETYSGSADDSVLSSETVSNSLTAYPIEAPANDSNLDASFVTFHQFLAPDPLRSNNEKEDHDDTIVDVDIASSLSISQKHISQTVPRSDALDHDDLELLDVLEGLADSEFSVVDSNSILGSQKSQSTQTSKVAPSIPTEELDESEEEDCHWMDKTLSAEDEMKKLLDLTMPDLDQLNLSQIAMNTAEPKPGPSGINLQIVDTNNFKSKSSQNSSSSADSDRIPQTDGADDIPVKQGRRSLGIRGGRRKQVRKKASKIKRNRLPDDVEGVYMDKNIRPADDQSCNTVCLEEPQNESSSPSITVEPSNQEDSTASKCAGESPAIHFVHNDEKVILFSKDVCQEECCKGILDTHDNKQSTSLATEDTSIYFEQSQQPVVQSFALIPLTESLLNSENIFDQSFIQEVQVLNTLVPPVACCPTTSICSAYTEDNHEQNGNFESSDSTKCKEFIPGCEEKDDEDNVLRGDPSLYQNSVYEPEWLADLITEQVRKVNSEGGDIIGSCSASSLVAECPESTNCAADSSLVRRSTRLALKVKDTQCASLTGESNGAQSEFASTDSADMPVEGLEPSSSWSPCSCNEISDIPELSSSAFFDMRESLGTFYSSSMESSLVDKEMRRFSGALKDGQMEVILQTGMMDSDHGPALSRRDELMNALQTQAMECQGTCSKARKKRKKIQVDDSDPVTDEILHRGRKALPGPPPLTVNRGKDMHLAAKYYKKPSFKSFDTSKEKGSSFSSPDSSNVALITRKMISKEKRKKRKLKLSLSYRNKSKCDPFPSLCDDSSPRKTVRKRGSSQKEDLASTSRTQVTSTSQLKSCFVLLDRLTRENINKTCKQYKVKLLDKSFFGIRKGRTSRFGKEGPCIQGTLYEPKESNWLTLSDKISAQVITDKACPKKINSSKIRSSSWNGTELKQARKRGKASNSKNALRDIKTKSPSCKGRRMSRQKNCPISATKPTSHSIMDQTSQCAPVQKTIDLSCKNTDMVKAVFDKETTPEEYHSVEKSAKGTMKNDDSGVDTHGEETSPHVVIFDEIPKAKLDENSINNAEEESSIALSLDASDTLLNSDLKTTDAISQSDSPPLKSLEVHISELHSFSSHKLKEKPIVCVDGASAESSSSESSGKSCSETPTANSEKVCLTGQSQSVFPEHEKHWFTQQFQPWISLWSPTSSPHHSIQMFSPPRPESPDTAHGVALPTSVGHSCMDSPSSSRNTSNDCIGSTPLLETEGGAPLPFKFTSRSQSSNNKEKGVDQENTSCCEPELDTKESKSAPTSQEHSVSDIFSEKSFCADSFDVGESRSSFDGHINLGLSPSYPYSDVGNQGIEGKKLQEKESGQDHKAMPMVGKPSSANVASQSSRGSSESSDFQCGQRLKQNKRKNYFASSHSNVFSPAQKPPSFKQVIDSLTRLGIPKVLNKVPFFSAHSDVKGKVEIGGNILSLTSHKCIHLDDFKSNIHGLVGINEQQQHLFKQSWALSQVQGDMNQLILSHASSRQMHIAPLIKPPSVREVLLWERARNLIQCRALDQEKVKLREERVPQPSHQEHNYNTELNSSSQCPSAGQRVKASTPKTVHSSVGDPSFLLSPAYTPILESTVLSRNINVKSRKCLGKAFGHPVTKTLPVISESEGDTNSMALQVLNSPNERKNQENLNSQEDASLQRLLLDSQFQKHAISPIIREAPDASACQIKGPSKSSPGYKLLLENLQDGRLEVKHQYTTVMCLELHIRTCGSLRPDPERDPICAVFYCIANDIPESSSQPTSVSGVIVLNDNEPGASLSNSGLQCNVTYAADENLLVQDTISLVRQWDPDIMVGYEIEMLSWGYLLQRAHTLGLNISQELSRVPKQKPVFNSDEDMEDNNGLCTPKLSGRILLDLWRLLRSELALQSYTFENVMYHILHQRISHHSFDTLSKWWEHPSHLFRWMTVEYYKIRVSGVIRIIEQLDLIGRTSELARLFGIQFFEVLSRGSQFRVESMMLRLAKLQNYVALSPSVQQRAHMRAPETVPLIMEPESRFYSDPVIVLDFQSLYPSIIIAYNYCFSTCLGRAEFLGKTSSFEFGCSNLRVSNTYLRRIKDSVNFSPCGVAFISAAVRRGILPVMLEEILEARLAVKQSMKQHKDNHVLQRLLHARQLGLKLIANVTYGYTSANFSGRMPCIEVGDSVVSKGRETLERAIALVNSNKDWQARVVYGDTDSMFVLVPGRNRQEAFKIGAEIAEAVTQDNPSPVKLKLEKVYQPCILQTKKRYVGYMYESPGQTDPVYEAKGIETVRRDGCPAVAKILEQSLRLLFEKFDVSLVKRYVCHQFSKLLAGRANIQDLIYAREYRGMANYRPGACVPALELTKKWLKTDRRAEPRIGERVPYVVINGPPGQALIHLVRHPHELLSDRSLRYNAVYYITRAIIPPLARCFCLLGADVPSWFSEIPRQQQCLPRASMPSGSKKTISQYFSTLECACCGELTHGGVCSKCRSKPQILATTLMDKAHSWEASYLSITKVCQSCLGRSHPLDCTSLDCPITYRRHQATQQLQEVSYLHQLLEECLNQNF